MGLSAAVGGFNAPASGTTGTTVSVTGLSFQPVVVFLWMTGRTETSDSAVSGTALSARSSFGMFSSTTSQYSWGGAHIDNQDFSLVAGIHRDNAVLIQAGGNNNYRTLKCTSMNSDGFTVEIGSDGSNAWAACRVHYLALGGTDLTNAKMGAVFPSAGTGNESFTPLSFQPDAVIFGNFANALNTFRDSDIAQTLGMATGASNQWLWGGQSADNLGTTDTNRYFRTDECGGNIEVGGGSMQFRTRFVSLDATGFTINKLEGGAGAWTQGYGAIKGGKIKAGSFTASSGGGSVTGLGFQPTAILFVTHGTTENSADSTSAEYVYSIGASVTGITQRCAHVHDIDNLGISDIVTAHRDDGVIITSNTSGTIDSRISVSSHDADGFTYTMPTNTNNGYKVGYLAFGPTAAAGAGARSFVAGMIG